MTPAPQAVAQGGQPLASTKTAMPISPDVAHFVSLLQSGTNPEKLYMAFPNQHPLIDEAVQQFGGGTAPVVNDPNIQNPGREQLDQEMHQTTQDLLALRGQNVGKVAQLPSSQQFNDGSTEIKALADQMRDMGYGGDADRLEAEVTYYDPEDIPMLVGDAQELLQQMQAKDAEHEGDQGSIHPQIPAPGLDPQNAENFAPVIGKEAGLPGDSPRDKKADEIYKAIRRDSDHDKSSAAAIANAEANDLEKKDDLELGNDDDKKSDDDKGGNPFAKKDDDDKGDKDSDSKDDKKDDDGKPPWLKKKDARASYDGLNGRIAAIFEGQWGDKLILLATEFGDITVPAEDVVAPVGDEAPSENPVAEINEFLQIIDPAGDVPATYHARIHNLGQVVREGRKVINLKTTSLADKIALDEIIVNASAEIEGLRVLAEEFVDQSDQDYVDAQAANAYGIGAGGVFDQAPQGGLDSTWLDETYHDMMSDVEGTDFDRVVNEEPQLLVDDMPDSALADAGVMQQMALSHITPKTAMVPEPIRTEINNAFVAATEQARRVQLAARKSHMAKTAAQLPDADGPAEGLFL